MKYGYLKLNIEKILKEKGISKNKICKDLDIARPNFNRYCQNRFQRIDAQLITKLCYYFECEVQDIITYVPPQKDTSQQK